MEHSHHTISFGVSDSDGSEAGDNHHTVEGDRDPQQAGVGFPTQSLNDGAADDAGVTYNGHDIGGSSFSASHSPVNAEQQQHSTPTVTTAAATASAASTEGSATQTRSVSTQTPLYVWIPPLRRLQKQPEPGSRKSHPADPSDPNPRKRPRKRYTPEQKQAVIAAGRKGIEFAREVGAMFGMPINTVGTILFKARKEREREEEEGEAHPGEHHGEESSSHNRSPVAMDKRRLPRRMLPADIEVMREALHEQCTLTAQQLLMIVNEEKIRRIMVELDAELPEEQRLSHNHKGMFKPLDCDTCLAIPQVREMYEETRVKSTRTIYRALRHSILTLKKVVTERSTMNSPENKSKRLQCAHDLLALQEDDSTYLVWVDEMPFYVASGRNYGRAPKGHRAVVRMAPTSTMSHRVQVAMAVSHQHGLLHGSLFPPQVQVSSTSKKRSLKAKYTKEEFKSFINGLLHTMWVHRHKLSLRRKRIVLLMDNASEHGKQSSAQAAKLLQGCPNFGIWRDWLDTSACSMEVAFLAPVSPTLNLAEFYNRVLRTKANVLRSTPKFAKKIADPDVPRGHKQIARVQALCSIIKKAMASLKKEGPHSSSTDCIIEEIQHVITLNGAIDKHWKPVSPHKQPHQPPTQPSEDNDDDGDDDDDVADDDDDDDDDYNGDDDDDADEA